MPSSLQYTLRQLWAREKFTYGVRVFIALAGAMALCWYLDRIAFVIPLFLGCIASALAESDDHWRGRTQALLVTLVCFGATATAVQLLFPYPWLFGSGLARQHSKNILASPPVSLPSRVTSFRSRSSTTTRRPRRIAASISGTERPSAT